MPKQQVLFLCTGNTARSQMAEALLRHHANDHFDVFSGGLRPSEIHPLTIKVMEEKGLSMDGYYSKDIKRFMGRGFYRYVIIVCRDADDDCPRALWVQSGELLYWPFDDPIKAEGTEEAQLIVFRRIRDEIDAKIQEWVVSVASEEEALAARRQGNQA